MQQSPPPPPAPRADLPEAAQRRLADLGQRAAGGHLLATTDFSVDELLLARAAGFVPLGMVMGSCVYHLGIQYGNWRQNMELQYLSAVMYNARELAMGRMIEEASALGADGIIGVQLNIIYHTWSAQSAEFTAIGTAIRHEGGEPWRNDLGQPFTSDLSGQAFWKLINAGYKPQGLVLGTCVYHVAHQGFMQQLNQAGQNTELSIYTQALYEARELAMSRMQMESERLNANLVVETKISHSQHLWDAHVMEFFAIGTAARGGADRPAVTPQLVVSADNYF